MAINQNTISTTSAVNTYNIVCRYMNGTEVTGFHLNSTGGESIKVSKDRLVYLINQGLVENARVQMNNGEVIIRGKGINMNKLPVYDEKTLEFREGNEGEAKITKKGIGQYRLINRVMYKTSVIRYVAVDDSGKKHTFGREKILELARQALISNAVVQRLNKKDGSEPQLILRGVNGEKLSELPILYVDKRGDIINPEKAKKKLLCRVVLMNKGGNLVDIKNNTSKAFSIGDFLVCYPNCQIDVLPNSEVTSTFEVKHGEQYSIACVDYINMVERYGLKFYSGEKIQLKQDQVMKWTVAERKARE